MKSCMARRFPLHVVIFCMRAKSPQSCSTLCDPMDYSPPGLLSVGFSRQEYWSGFLSMPSSRAFSQPRDVAHISYNLLHWQSDSLPLAPPGKPIVISATHNITMGLYLALEWAIFIWEVSHIQLYGAAHKNKFRWSKINPSHGIYIR